MEQSREWNVHYVNEGGIQEMKLKHKNDELVECKTNKPFISIQTISSMHLGGSNEWNDKVHHLPPHPSIVGGCSLSLCTSWNDGVKVFHLRLASMTHRTEMAFMIVGRLRAMKRMSGKREKMIKLAILVMDDDECVDIKFPQCPSTRSTSRTSTPSNSNLFEIDRASRSISNLNYLISGSISRSNSKELSMRNRTESSVSSNHKHKTINIVKVDDKTEGEITEMRTRSMCSKSIQTETQTHDRSRSTTTMYTGKMGENLNDKNSKTNSIFIESQGDRDGEFGDRITRNQSIEGTTAISFRDHHDYHPSSWRGTTRERSSFDLYSNEISIQQLTRNMKEKCKRIEERVDSHHDNRISSTFLKSKSINIACPLRKIKIIAASNLPPTSTSDEGGIYMAYARLRYGKQIWETRSECTVQGHVSWNRSFNLRKKKQSKELLVTGSKTIQSKVVVEIWGVDPLREHELLGTCIVALQDYPKTKSVRIWVRMRNRDNDLITNRYGKFPGIDIRLEYRDQGHHEGTRNDERIIFNAGKHKGIMQAHYREEETT